jgi:Lysophospholipase L1 and related esterases
MKRFYIIALLFSIVALMAFSKIKKVACVGDSITEGYGLACQSKTGYPVILNSILGPDYSVLNSGRSATTLQRKGDFPYWTAKEFTNVFVFQPDIIVIKLGTNDTKPYNWHPDAYEKDYQALIDTFKTIPSHPKIYLCLPVPVFKTKWGINDSTVVHGVIPIIKKVAKANNLPVIDLYHSMKDQGANFPDSIHPNEQAVKVMAGIIAKEIKK